MPIAIGIIHRVFTTKNPEGIKHEYSELKISNELTVLLLFQKLEQMYYIISDSTLSELGASGDYLLTLHLHTGLFIFTPYQGYKTEKETKNL